MLIRQVIEEKVWEIEESFEIEIPDEYMNSEFLLSFDHIVDIVEDLLINTDTILHDDETKR